MTEKASIKLEWNNNPEPNLAYYTLRYGTAPGVYTHSQNIGIPVGQTKPATTTVVNNLEPHTIYYFNITATNKSGQTSQLAREVSAFVGKAGVETGTTIPAVIIPTTAVDDPRKTGQEITNKVQIKGTDAVLTVTAADLTGNTPNVVTVEQSSDLQNWKPIHQEVFSGTDNAALLKFNLLLKDANKKDRNFFRSTSEPAPQIGTANIGGVEKAVYKIPAIPSDDPRIDGEYVKNELTTGNDGRTLTVTAADLPGSGTNKLTLQTSTDLKTWTDAKQFSFGGSDNSELLKLQIKVQDTDSASPSSPTMFFRAKLDQEPSK